MARKMKIFDPRTGREMIVYMKPVHKPPAVQRKSKPMMVHSGPRRKPPGPLFQHPEFYPYQYYNRRSRAVSWFIGLVGFFGSFVACEISPVLTIAGWGLTIAILAFRAIRD